MRTLQSELNEKGLAKKENLKVDSKKLSPKINDERLTERDLRELMGMGRDTFKRVGGAIRRR